MESYQYQGRKLDPVAKAWGEQRPELRLPTLHVHTIDVRSGGYCSVHRHPHKHNIFQVIRGTLMVLTFNDHGLLVRTDQLEAAGHCLIRAGWLHQFWTRTGCLAQEVYYGTADGNLQVRDDDIERMAGKENGGLALSLDSLPSLLEPANA